MGNRGGQGGTSRGGGGQGGTSRGGAGNSGGDAGETVGGTNTGGTPGAGGEPATAGEGGDGGGGGVGPCPGRDRWCEGDVLHSCEGATEWNFDCRAFFGLSARPPLESICWETNGDAACAVHVGETCITYEADSVYQLPCVEENAACVASDTTATCVADIGPCTEETACIGSFRVHYCNFDRPYGHDCRAVDASATCQVDAEGRSYCAGLPLGSPCDSNADGMMGPGHYPGNRCAPGLSCVLTGGVWRCAL